MPLRMLIMRAYRLLEFHLVGGPDWVNTERYDIVGLAPGATTSDDITPRLQTLLADRFKLTMHMEKKEMPVLWLVLADKDGRLGPKLHRSTADCPLLPPAGVSLPQVCFMRGHVGFPSDGRLKNDYVRERLFANHAEDGCRLDRARRTL
jgi:uncharacterized protein (TIGR03435 family)